MCGLDCSEGLGLHPLNELATLAEVLGQFACGELEGCSSFVYPSHLQEQPHDCYVALALFRLCLQVRKWVKFCRSAST